MSIRPSEASKLCGEYLSHCLDQENFFSIGVISSSEFERVVEETSTPRASIQRYLEQPIGSVIVVALRYAPGEYPLPDCIASHSEPESLAMSIATFARAHWYGELLLRLERAVRNARTLALQQGLPIPAVRQWRRLSNSRLPEKSLAVAAGLGFIGKNGILIASRRRSNAWLPGGIIQGESESKDVNPQFSSAVVLGCLLSPENFDFSWNISGPDIPSGGCGTCRRCILACPTAALNEDDPKYIRTSCIQHWTALEGKLPEPVAHVWGQRLYGCDECLKACPYYRVDEKAETQEGRLGPSISASFFLEHDEKTIRKALSGTALGLPWMSIKAFKRSAAFVASGIGSGHTARI